MYLAGCEIIPPKEWHHDPTLEDNCEKTVAAYLAEKGIDPEEWL